MINGLDLFSGIGGLSVALRQWVRPVCYCEIDPYCQAVLLSRFDNGELPRARIWDDITTFPSIFLRETIDIMYGGFPCQDISCAGNGKGLAGKRSGLFYEMLRLAKEIEPKFIFIENVPAITTRGGLTVVNEIASLGYDCRWCVISAASVGAPHLRKRWFLLAYSQSKRSQPRVIEGRNEKTHDESCNSSEIMANPVCQGFSFGTTKESKNKSAEHSGQTVAYSKGEQGRGQCQPESQSNVIDGSNRGDEAYRWSTEPNVGRVVDGVPFRVDRIKGLGNAVVPQQAKKAFQILMGNEPFLHKRTTG